MTKIKILVLVGITAVIHSCNVQLDSEGGSAKSMMITAPSSCVNLVLCQSAIIDSSAAIYQLESSYLDTDIPRLMKIDGEDIYLNLSSLDDHWELLFSFSANVGNHQRITILDGDWGNGNGLLYVKKQYVVKRLALAKENDERFALVKVERMIQGFPDMGDMDAMVVFSDRSGFVGSFYHSRNLPESFIEKRGDVKETLFGMSHYTSWVIR